MVRSQAVILEEVSSLQLVCVPSSPLSYRAAIGSFLLIPRELPIRTGYHSHYPTGMCHREGGETTFSVVQCLTTQLK